jgi:hypothetical protein
MTGAIINPDAASALDSDHAALSADIDGYRRGAIIHALVHFEVIEHLRAGSASSALIADRTGTNPIAMARLLEAATAVGLLEREADGRYRPSPRGALLDATHPRSVARHARLSVVQYWPAWSRLTDSLNSGQTVFEEAFGCSPWEYRSRHPEQGRLFDAWMQEESRKAVAAIIACLDLSADARVADIAGGKGTLLEACLARWPHLHGVLFEQPHTLRSAKPVESGGFAGRLEHLAGDMFVDIPVRADCLLLKSVLHDWDDDRALQVLKHCAATMGSHDRLIIVERLLESGLSAGAYLIDLHMMLVTGGQERTLEAYAALADAAGLIVTACTRTATDFSLIECRRKPG